MVQDDATPSGRSGVCSTTIGWSCPLAAAWCFLCGSGRERTCFDGNGERGRKLYQKRKLVYGWEQITASNQRHSFLLSTNMGNEHSQPDGRVKLPKIEFRVLIIGRANAGKTSILQRVCDTTDSPVIYRRTGDGKKKEKVRGQRFLWSCRFTTPLSSRFDSILPSMSVTFILTMKHRS